MFIETIKTPGLAHLSYIVGSAGEAAVIDPRRDVGAYISIAKQHDCRIKYIFETHRNEDLISGAAILAKLTQAEVKHGPNADGKVQYADIVKQGERFKVGHICLEILETPGHTKDSISILLFDSEYDSGAVGVFSGDTLFVGDVGRTDFYPEQAAEMAGMLFDSLQLIADKAKHAIVYPAHGAGSVCGDGMAEREFSTVAHELSNNPMLQINKRDEFITNKLAEQHYRAPYFSVMEQLNLEGASATNAPRIVSPLKLIELQSQKHGWLIDVRPVEGFLAAHYPGSVCLPVAMLTAYAGWLFHPEDNITLIAQDDAMASAAALHLARIGFDNTQRYVVGSFTEFAAMGGDFTTLDTLTAAEVKELQQQDWQLLDVRKITEYQQRHIKGSQQLFLGHLATSLDQLDPETHYITMCASGMRASVAASYLRANGINNVKVFMGSLGAWLNASYPVEG
ncbi:rhodanese-like domain-containing protein [Pseudoalteromonas sp.]|uniref:MBL fold metallo-hydrolase n=1 Tax=Pseudoalteromonas sp. TaxID=53249 RepID=UPI0035634F3C